MLQTFFTQRALKEKLRIQRALQGHSKVTKIKGVIFQKSSILGVRLSSEYTSGLHWRYFPVNFAKTFWKTILQYRIIKL